FDAMARKTVLKALFSKYAPKSITIQQAIKFDQAVVKANGIDGEDINIDTFEAVYIDNVAQVQDATAEEVDPSKGLFPEGNDSGKAADNGNKSGK
ncbi:MAG: recombinase RecT, partial [Prevotella sp.]|nr:recombinase RecT [Prevotella sp.]